MLNSGNLAFLLKTILTLWVLGYLYNILKEDAKGIAAVSQVSLLAATRENAIWLAMLMLLIPLNWALESRKWQILVSKTVHISFAEAFRSTLSGLVVGMVFLSQIGDALGRIAALDSSLRARTLGAVFVSGGIQFSVSLLAGVPALIYLQPRLNLPAPAYTALLTIILFAIIACILCFRFRKQLLSWPVSIPWIRRLRSYMEVISLYSWKEIFPAFIFGVWRYLVYLAQFAIGLVIFDFSLSLPDMTACIVLILLVKTVVPAINVIGDLGLRGVTALYIFEHFNISPEKVIAVTFLVWLCNIGLPVIAGLAMVWKYKWKLS